MGYQIGVFHGWCDAVCTVVAETASSVPFPIFFDPRANAETAMHKAIDTNLPLETDIYSFASCAGEYEYVGLTNLEQGTLRQSLKFHIHLQLGYLLDRERVEKKHTGHRNKHSSECPVVPALAGGRHSISAPDLGRLRLAAVA